MTGGVGIGNTRARLQQLYGDEASSLSLGEAAGGGTVATVVIPFHTTRDLRISDQPREVDEIRNDQELSSDGE
jgi:hypothetical protein